MVLRSSASARRTNTTTQPVSIRIAIAIREPVMQAAQRQETATEDVAMADGEWSSGRMKTIRAAVSTVITLSVSAARSVIGPFSVGHAGGTYRAVIDRQS